MNEEVLSLFEFTSRIGNTIHTNPSLQNVWLVAELSDVAVRGGHFYADLLQKSDDGKTVARLRANLWASRYDLLRRRYFASRGEDLRTGIKVKIRGAATHHNLFGLSFNITDIDPEYVDEGDILRRRMEILNALATQGIAEENKSVPLNPDTQNIAVISAEGAAGYGDFINQLSFNPEQFRFNCKLFPSPMQGERAAAGVIAALERVAGDPFPWDCVVIIRGGGASADMNCFDDYQLALNVCTFPLPVLVGIGHERDNCVLDYIANTRCKTPTAVAEFLINHQREAWQKVCDAVTLITREATLRLEGENRRMTQLETFIPSFVRQYMDRESLRLKNLTDTIPLTIKGLTTREHARLDSISNQLEPTLANALSRAKEQLRSLYNMVTVLSPENTLKRGYSITRVDGKAIRDASSVAPGTMVETTLASGTIKSTTL